MNIKIYSIWQGKVGIRDKQMKEAVKCGESLKFTFGSEEMEIPNNEIIERVIAKSEKQFKDKFSEEMHYLVYFNWRPRSEDDKMREFSIQCLS